MTESRGTVLIVDPDERARARSELVLARAGFRLVSATTGTTALRLATRLLPDNVLTEIDVPKLDGFRLARRLRAQPATEHLAVVALTSYGSDDLTARANEAGFSAVIRKPFAMHDLLRIVAETTRQSREARGRSERLRADVDQLIAETHDVMARVRQVRALSDTVARDHALLAPEQNDASLDEQWLIDQADGARDVMMVDPSRGASLFEMLFKQRGDHPILRFKRGEAYRALGRRKQAHQDFVVATDLFPPGRWRARARFAAMRSRSHHDRDV